LVAIALPVHGVSLLATPIFLKGTMMRTLKMMIIAAGVAGFSITAMAQDSGTDKTMGQERQQEIQHGINPATKTVGGVTHSGPKVNSSTNGSAPIEGTKGQDRQNALEHGKDPATSDR
jgi:hypothetical protein